MPCATVARCLHLGGVAAAEEDAAFVRHDLFYTGAGADRDALGGEDLADDFGRGGVGSRQQLGRGLDHGDLAAETAQRLRQLAADRAGAEARPRQRGGDPANH